MDASTGINAQDAGLFSQDAYHDPGTDETANLGDGWAEDETDEKTADGTWIDQAVDPTDSSTIDQFRVFVNSSLHEIVFAFKGTDNWTDLKSDLTNDGASRYNALIGNADLVLNRIEDNPVYASYHIYTDGHSLGGGMAQNFSFENHLDGFGQNSLPVTVATDVSTYSNQFIETYVAGDPATLLYSDVKAAAYLDPRPTMIPSAYAAGEVFGLAATGFTGGFSLAISAFCAFQAHRIETFNSLAATYSVDTDGRLLVPVSTINPPTDARWLADELLQPINVLQNPDGSVSVSEYAPNQETNDASSGQFQYGYTADQFKVQATDAGSNGLQIAAVAQIPNLVLGGDDTLNGTAFISGGTSANPGSYNVGWSVGNVNGSYTYGADGSFNAIYAYNGFTEHYSSSNGAITGYWLAQDGTNFNQFSFDADGSFTQTGDAVFSENGGYSILSDGTSDFQFDYANQYGYTDHTEEKRYTDGTFEIITTDAHTSDYMTYAPTGSWEHKTEYQSGVIADSFGTADGSSWGSTYFADGSSSTFTNNGQGNIVDAYFNAAGTRTADEWQLASGAAGDDSVTSTGSLSEAYLPSLALDFSYATAFTRNSDGSSQLGIQSQLGDTTAQAYASRTAYTDGSSTYAASESDRYGDGLSLTNNQYADGSAEHSIFTQSSDGLSTYRDLLSYGDGSSDYHFSGGNSTTGYAMSANISDYADGSSHVTVSASHANGTSSYAADEAFADGSSNHSFSATDGSGVFLTNVFNADGSSEYQVSVNNGDGSASYRDVKYLTDGTFDDATSTTASDGTTTSYSETTGSTSDPRSASWAGASGLFRTDTITAATHQYEWTSGSSVDGDRIVYDFLAFADGSLEHKMTFSFADGYSFTEDDKSFSDGSYERDWSSSDGGYDRHAHSASAGLDEYHTRYADGYGGFRGTDYLSGNGGYLTTYEQFHDGSYMTDTVSTATGADSYAMHSAVPGLSLTVDR